MDALDALGWVVVDSGPAMVAKRCVERDCSGIDRIDAVVKRRPAGVVVKTQGCLQRHVNELVGAEV